MKTITGCCLLLSFLFIQQSIAQNDTTVSGSKVHVKVKGHSGKFIISLKDDVESDNNRVEIDLDELKELDDQNNPVSTTGSTKHSFNTFANQDFTISEPIDVVLSNINMKSINFATKLKDLNSSISLTVYIAMDSGTLSIGGESIPIAKNNIKFSIILNQWSWCTTNKQCKADGSSIDLSIAVRSKGAPVKKNKDNSTGDATPYSIGYGTVLLSHRVQIDYNQWVSMPANYPTQDSQGGKQRFTFRFPKFTQSALYDPTVALNQDEPSSGCDRATLNILVALAAFLVKMFLA